MILNMLGGWLYHTVLHLLHITFVSSFSHTPPLFSPSSSPSSPRPLLSPSVSLCCLFSFFLSGCLFLLPPSPTPSPLLIYFHPCPLPFGSSGCILSHITQCSSRARSFNPNIPIGFPTNLLPRGLHSRASPLHPPLVIALLNILLSRTFLSSFFSTHLLLRQRFRNGLVNASKVAFAGFGKYSGLYCYATIFDNVVRC